MKIDTAKPYERTSTVQGEDIAMSIDQDAMSHIMGILTNMYEDAELAVIREYATNALDSHRAAGNTDPIQVTTPTALRPVFTVQDFGLGLSPQEVRDIYSRYGASTKRDTNEQTGMLGIGCKAALAYCDQFTLRAVKRMPVPVTDAEGEPVLDAEGKPVTEEKSLLTHIQVARDEQGGGRMTVIEAGEVDEPNGVLVSIPVPRDNALESKARDLFSYWDKGTVELNGKLADSIWDESPSRFALTPDIMVRTDAANSYNHEQAAVVVQGGVPYEATLPMKRIGYQHQVVVRVPIGSVNFAPSREALMDTKRTRDTLKGIAERIESERKLAPQRAVEGAATKGEALAAYASACAAVNLFPEGIMWQGRELPSEIPGPTVNGPTDARYWHIPAVRGHWRGARSDSSRIRAVDLRTAGICTWITNYTNTTWTKANRDKLDAYMTATFNEGRPESLSYIAQRGAKLVTDWLDGVRVIDWQDVRKWRDPDAPKRQGGGGGTKFAGTYPAIGADGVSRERLPAEDIEKADHVFIASYYPGMRSWKMLNQSNKGSVVLVRVTASRRAKFDRLFPNTRSEADGLEVAHRTWRDRLTAEQLEVIAFHRHADMGAKQAVEGLRADDLDDPDLAKCVRRLNADLPNGYTEHGGHAVEAGKRPSELDALTPLIPILRVRAYTFPSAKAARIHKTLYANAVYAANERG